VLPFCVLQAAFDKKKNYWRTFFTQ